MCVCVRVRVHLCIYTWMAFTDILSWPIVYVPYSTAGEGTTISRPPLNTDNNGIAILRVSKKNWPASIQAELQAIVGAFISIAIVITFTHTYFN